MTASSRERLPATILHHLLALLDPINPLPKLTQMLQLIVLLCRIHPMLNIHFWDLYLYKPPASCSSCNFYVLVHMGRNTAPTAHLVGHSADLLTSRKHAEHRDGKHALFSFPAERSGLLHKVTEICIDLFWQEEQCF